MISDLQTRLIKLAAPGMHLHALVDGLQYRDYSGGESLADYQGALALFLGTADEALSDAGPCLIDVETADRQLLTRIEQLEYAAHAVTWIVSPLNTEDLAARLRRHLDVRLPDGRTAMLRFWDPRVLAVIAQHMDENQRRQFFGDIVEWHLLLNGRRARIGRHHADTH